MAIIKFIITSLVAFAIYMISFSISNTFVSGWLGGTMSVAMGIVILNLMK